jgi:hypothetical protein
MFEEWKRKREAKKAKDLAIAEAQYWKNHPRLRVCLQAMRGSCTLASQALHEAAIAVVNIALMEGAWETVEIVPADFMEDMVFLVWDDEKLPVLKAPWGQVRENLDTVTAVAKQAFLVAQTLDRIIWFDAQSSIKIYTIV